MTHPLPHADAGTIPVFDRWVGSWQFSVQRRALSGPQLARSYDRAAPGWARTLDRLGFPGAYEELLARVLADELPDAAGMQPRVLDCGVRTGALSSALARVMPGRVRLDAIDLSPRMLERAGDRLRADGLEAALQRGDARALPYDDGTFDIVMTAHMLEHLPDPGVALTEMVRVLKPGGVLIACISRRSFSGMLIHLKWRTHRVRPAEGERWLRDVGLANARSLSFDGRPVCRMLSLACTGRKPVRNTQNRSKP